MVESNAKRLADAKQKGKCVSKGKGGVSRASRRKLLERIDVTLEDVYKSPRHGNYRDPTTELFYLLLTVRTRISDVRPRLRALKQHCETWDGLADAVSQDLVPILAPLGFGTKRASVVVQVAKQIRADAGKVDLVFLKRRSHEEALSYLRSLPFVGEKVARCVALYSLAADISPMDANATRVLSRTGALPRNILPKHAHVWIDQLVARGRSYSLHVNLVAHGQTRCKGLSPLCEGCALMNLCRFFRTGH
jgi:endonuclease-3